MTQEINDTRDHSSITLNLPADMVRELDLLAKSSSTSREGIVRTLIERGIFYEQNKDVIEHTAEEISKYVVARGAN